MKEKITVTQTIEYKPSIIGRLARFILSVMRALLPPSAFKWTYEKLYNMYYGTLRVFYWLHLIAAYLSGNSDTILRAKLTKQLLPFTMGGRKALENAFDVIKLVEEKKLHGSIVECGVAQGGTAAMMSLASKKLGQVSRVKWLFDSYEGLPEPTQEDYVGDKLGEFIQPLPKGACLGTIQQVSELIYQKLGFSAEEVHLVKGWFQDTVPVKRDAVGQIAVLRLDGDWYESTKIPLENFYSQIVLGGYVIVDDYATCFGSRRAVDEFRESNKIESPLIPDGRGGVWFEKTKS